MANTLEHLLEFLGYRVEAYNADGERQWVDPFGNHGISVDARLTGYDGQPLNISTTTITSKKGKQQ